MTLPKGKEKEKKNVPLADVIRQEAEEAKRDQFGSDDEFDPNRDLGLHGPTAFSREMRDRDQLVIDELLSSLPKNQGYYLKLYKEIMPGKYELKEKIDQYDTWTDLELEVAERVKAFTRKFGSKKWGSGLYRLVVWRSGGIRETNKYNPIDVVVDAGDAEDAAVNMHGRVDPLEATNEQLQALGNMLNAVRGIMPAPADANAQFQAIANAFMAGKGDKKEESSMTMQLMMTMMTAFMGVFKDLAMGNRPTEQTISFEQRMAQMLAMFKDFGIMSGSNSPKSLTDQVAELKILGIDPFKREDTIEQIAKLKTLMGTVTDLVPQNGKVDRPGILEKLIDALAPHVPKMVADLKAVTDNAALVQTLNAKHRVQQPTPEPPKPVEPSERPTTSYGQPVGPQPNRMGAGDAFVEERDMDPYSGFTTRPFSDPRKERKDVEIFGSGDFATGRKVAPPPMQQNVSPVQPEPRVAPMKDPAVVPVSEQPFVLPPLLQQLEVLVKQNIVGAYPSLYQTLSQFPESKMMLDGIKIGVVTVESMVNELRQAGGPVYNHPSFVEQLASYFEGFIRWINENEKDKVLAICDQCGAQHQYESRGHFDNDPQGYFCGIEIGGGRFCQGRLSLKEAEHVASAKA